MRLPLSALTAFTLLIGPAGIPANANPAKGYFTTIEIKTCRIVKRHQDGNTWSCPGLPGFPVSYAEGDLRSFVSYGPDATKRRAATQTLGPFNSIFKGKLDRATVEWRIGPRGKLIPHATILRYFTDAEGRKGETLVVTKVTASEACHVAYIDALSGRGAMALARRIADEIAPTFDCSKEPRKES